MPFSCPWNDQESIIAIDPVEGEGITDTAETDVPNVAWKKLLWIDERRLKLSSVPSGWRIDMFNLEVFLLRLILISN